MPKGELLPCPFCGEKASIERVGDRRQSTIYSCDGCGCTLETGEEFGHGRAWNRRSDRAGLIAGLREAEHILCEMPRSITNKGVMGYAIAAPNVDDGILAIRARIAALETEEKS